MDGTPQKARVLNAEDVITADTYTIIEGPDRKGNFLLANDITQKRTRAHPTRILRIVPGGGQVKRVGTEIHAYCPCCSPDAPGVAVEIAQDAADCAEHGKFAVDWSGIDAGPRPATPELEKKQVGVKQQKTKKVSMDKGAHRSKSPMQIDFAAMRAAGEVWTKSGVEFDYPGFDVRAHVLIIDDESNSRKLCFNSYNGTWGKKSKDDELQLFLANQKGQGCKVIGYYIKGQIDQERRKLLKNGYVRDE